MSYSRGNYQSRFVAASGSGSRSSTVSGNSYSGSMSNVPPPAALTLSTGGVPAPSLNSINPSSYLAQSSSKERDKQKELDESTYPTYAMIEQSIEGGRGFYGNATVYSLLQYANLMFYGAKTEQAGRRKKIYDDAYLEGEDSDDDTQGYRDLARRNKHKAVKKEEVDDEEDDLDAFMAGIDAQARDDKEVALKKDRERLAGLEEETGEKKGIGRTDIDEEDMQESYFKFLDEKKESAKDDDDEYEYDHDGNIIWTWKKIIDPLPAMDHSQVSYPAFHKNFYIEHEEITNMNHLQLVDLRAKLGVKVGGLDPPRPVCSFAHFGFDKVLMDSIRKSEFSHPTSIQAQAIPAALSGRDVLGIAKTGSGKTAAYLWPAIIHIMDQPDLAVGDGPIALVVVPTRELAIQVYQEAKKYCKAYNINVICAYGGGSKWEQSNELKGEGAELVVCTPGRIIDLVKIGATNFLRTTMLIFDEADRMFDMGFEAQVKSISDHIRPDRQCLMFSATFKKKVERLARDALQDPVRIVQGHVGEANEDVKQSVEVLPTQESKWNWLISRLVQFASVGKVLIFVTKKQNSEDLAKKLQGRDFKLVLLHGDMGQAERNEKLQAFRKSVSVMVATDIAARGLDIPEIRTVINYDLAKDIDTHVHRVGRTGRAGQTGNAYTLVTDKDTEMVGHLVRNLESVNQMVPEKLTKLAMKSAWFRAQRQGGGGGQQIRARPGLGYEPKQRPVPGQKEAHSDPLKEGPRTSYNSRSLRDTVREASTSEPGPAANNRLHSLKNTFKKSFAMTFHRATEQTSELPQTVVSDPRPEWKRKIDEINERFKLQKQQMDAAAAVSSQSETPPAENNDDAAQRKRSRWQ